MLTSLVTGIPNGSPYLLHRSKPTHQIEKKIRGLERQGRCCCFHHAQCENVTLQSTSDTFQAMIMLVNTTNREGNQVGWLPIQSGVRDL